MNLELISIIIGICIGAGALFVGVGYAYSQWKAGGDKYKDNLIDTLKESVSVLEEKNKRLSEEKSLLIQSHQQQLTDLTRQFSEMKGRFEEQQKTNEQYKLLLQGRDPEQAKIMLEIRDFLGKLNNSILIRQ